MRGSYSYIFDADEREFIYVSESNDLIEKTILELDQDQGLENLVQQSNEQTVSLNCSTTERIFLIKRMAANLFFGLCVANNPETKQTAMKAMASAFQVEDVDYLKV